MKAAAQAPMTHVEYMSATDGKAAHSQYYGEIAKAVGVRISTELAKRCAKALQNGDEHLNTIPLESWDRMTYKYEQAIRPELKRRGDIYSLAHGVCTMKAAAKAAAQTTKA